MTATLRPATPGDAAVIADLQARTWRGSYVDFLDRAYLATLDATDKVPMWRTSLALSADQFHAVVAIDDLGTPVAYGAIDFRRDVAVFDLVGLYVLPTSQGRGIGRNILGHLESLAVAARRPHGQLSTFVASNAVRCFERAGWRITARKTTRRGATEAGVVVMRKDLPAPV